jgi:hypothetical protein
MDCKKPEEGRIFFQEISRGLAKIIQSTDFLNRARSSSKHFTRKRKMGFKEVVYFMLNRVKSSTQTALDRFFDMTKGGEVHMTEQSFSDARQKLNWEACRELYEYTVKSVYAGEITTWHGFRVLAIDGSKVQLPADNKLREYFGCAGPTQSAPTGQMSYIYDYFNDIIVDAELVPFNTNERELAKLHIERLRAMSADTKELVLLDRGYPSFELFSHLRERKIEFLARVKKGFNANIDALPLGEHDFVLEKNQEALPVRVIKFRLTTGEVETLITSILEDELGIKTYKQLYNCRWGIETKYYEMKHKFELENFSGRTINAIYQDFYISALLSNMVAVAANEVQPIVDMSRADNGNKHAYHVNKNHAVGVFKDRFIRALMEPNAPKQAKMIEEIMLKLEQHVVPYRPGRSFPRKDSPRRANFHHNLKSNS